MSIDGKAACNEATGSFGSAAMGTGAAGASLRVSVADGASADTVLPVVFVVVGGGDDAMLMMRVERWKPGVAVRLIRDTATGGECTYGTRDMDNPA